MLRICMFACTFLCMLIIPITDLFPASHLSPFTSACPGFRIRRWYWPVPDPSSQDKPDPGEILDEDHSVMKIVILFSIRNCCSFHFLAVIIFIYLFFLLINGLLLDLETDTGAGSKEICKPDLDQSKVTGSETLGLSSLLHDPHLSDLVLYLINMFCLG